MRARTISSITLATALIAFTIAARASARQSGRATMSGYVAFDDLSYNDAAERKVLATIELRSPGASKASYIVKTDEHGLYSFVVGALGEFEVRISSPGYATYTTTVYLPSDFQCHLGTLLKKARR